MTDYVAIVLNGLFTGMGVIFAKELWDLYKKYQEKVKNEIKDIVTTHNGNGKIEIIETNQTR
jgi:hypothetical protein